MNDTGPGVSRRQQEERAALRTLQAEMGAPWMRLGVTWVAMAAVMAVIQVWLRSEEWVNALIGGALFGTFFVLITGTLDWRKRRRIQHVAGVSELELGTVTARFGDRVAVHGSEHEVIWRSETAVALNVGDEVYAAPRIAPDERIVLIRIGRKSGFLPGVMGPRDVAQPRVATR